jgi:hypothetical protein
MLKKIIEKYKEFSTGTGSGYTFLISVDDYNELIKLAKLAEKQTKKK